MTDVEISQLRENLMQQFNQMMTEPLPVIPEEYLSQTRDWGGAS